MHPYPAFLEISGKRCLVVGAGRVGLRKISGLLDSGPEIMVLDPAPPSPEVRGLVETGAVKYEQREFEPSDLEGVSLAFAATSNREANREIASACRLRGVPVNVADDRQASDFLVPAAYTNHGVTLAVGTGGISPALARRIRIDLQDRLDKRYGHLLALMEILRPMIIDLGRDSDENARVFRELVSSPLMDALYENKPHKARKYLANILPRELHPRIEELIDASI